MTGKSKIKTEWILFGAFLLFYLIIPNNNQGYDSYSYAISAKDSSDLFHPHHLIYNLFGYVLFGLFSFTGLGSLKILSLANTVFAAFTLMFIYKILIKRSGYFEAVAGTVITGLFFSFWYYATSVEVNMPAIFFVICALYFLLVKNQYPTSGWLVYILLCVGMLFHQIVALIGFPIFIYDVIRSNSITFTLKRAHPGIILGALIYLIVAIESAARKNAVGIYEWITGYGHAGEWGVFRLSNISQGVWGKIKAMFGGEIVREIFYSGQWNTFSMIYIGLMVLVYLGFTYLFFIVCIKLYKVRDRGGILILALMIVLGLFNGWWAPHDDGFWLYPFVLFGLFAFGQPLKRKIQRVIAGSMTALLLIMNISCEFIPSTDKHNSHIYQGALAFERLKLTPDDLVITNLSQIRLAYEYYSSIHVPTTCMMFLPPGEKDSVISDYHERIADTFHNGRVYMFEDEIHPDDYRGYLFTRFSAEDYYTTYERYFEHLVAADSVYIHGRYVTIYRLTM